MDWSMKVALGIIVVVISLIIIGAFLLGAVT